MKNTTPDQATETHHSHLTTLDARESLYRSLCYDYALDGSRSTAAGFLLAARRVLRVRRRYLRRFSAAGRGNPLGWQTILC